MNSISKSYKIFRESVNALINTPEYAEVAPDLERLKRCLNPLFIFTHLMTRGNGSSANELDDHICDHLGAEEAPTVSALTQALHSYTPGLFKKLFKILVDKLPLNETFKDYLLTAYDGSKINIFFDHIMEDYFFPAKKKKSGKGYHQLHLTAAYDVLNHVFVDFVTQPGRKTDEREAMIQLIQTQIADSASNIADCEEAGQPKKRIHLADRGFESYSLVATLIMMEQLFLIRGRDITSNGIARSIPKQDSPTFDIDWEITLTVRHTKETQQYHPEKYKILSKTQWKYKLEELKEYHLKLRVVRVEIAPGKYEVILTNLDRKEFPPEVLKELYGLRWNLEVAFRKLKYQVGLSFFHHKKLDFIDMELTARMIFYNFCGAVFMKLNTGIPEGRQLDFAYLVSQLRKYIQEGGTRGAYFEKKIVKNTIPVRPDRKFKRNVRAQSFIFFTNRG